MIKAGLALLFGFLIMLVIIGFGILAGAGEAGYETGGEIGADTIDSGSGYDTAPTYIQCVSTVSIVGEQNGYEST